MLTLLPSLQKNYQAAVDACTAGGRVIWGV